MRFSLKILLLSVALLAILAAWIRVRHDHAVTESKLSRNAHQGIKTISVPETSSPPSQLTIDATGTVTQANLFGPNGYAAINERTGARNQISSLGFGSTQAIALFEPDQFPELAWLAIDDSFDVDFTRLSLDWLERIHRLEGLNINASTSDPRLALATFPRMQPLMLVLRTNQVDSFVAFPRIRSVSSLSIGVPDGRDTDAILRELQNHSSDYTIEVRDGYNP